MSWTTVYAAEAAEIRYAGETTGAEILEAKQELFSHAFAEGPHYVICDFTPVETFSVLPADVRRIVEQDRVAARTTPGLVEVVIAPTPVSYGSARMWGLMVEDVRPRTWVGRTRGEVLQWLVDEGVELTPGHRAEFEELRRASEIPHPAVEAH